MSNSIFEIAFVYLLVSLIPETANIQQNSKIIEKWAEQLALEVKNVVEKNFSLKSLNDQASYYTFTAQGPANISCAPHLYTANVFTKSEKYF